MDAFAREKLGDAREDLVVGLAVLCHDLGKPATTEINAAGRVISHRHEPEGEARTHEFLARLTEERALADEVVPLVAAHLAPFHLFRDRASDAAVRRLAKRVGRIDRLVRVASADMRGRPPLEVGRFEAGEWLLERARALAVERSKAQPLVQGRDLIELGLAPGPAFGPLLEACYEAQLDGKISSRDEGLAYAQGLARERGLVA
jgi:tRNA nucleotidyltransferase (CCA-adding enzyme)